MSAGGNRGGSRKKPHTTSTPEMTKNATMMSLDFSTIGKNTSRGRHSTMPGSKPFLLAPTQLTVSPTVTAQEELDFAYNDFLLTVAANRAAERSMEATKSEIKVQLRVLSDRLVSERESLGRSEERLSEIESLTEQSALLDKLDRVLFSDQALVTPARDSLEDIIAAVQQKLNRLRLKNALIADVKSGIAELKQHLAVAGDLLSQISELSHDRQKMAAMAGHVGGANALLGEVRAKQQRILTVLPTLQGLCVKEAAVRGVEECKADETNVGDEEVEDASLTL